MEIKKLLAAVGFVLISFVSRAVDPSVSVYINDISYVSSKIIEFDIMMKANGSTSTFELRTFQAGLYVNPSWVNGGTLTMQNVSSYTQLSGTGYNGSFQWNPTDNMINCSVNFGYVGTGTCFYTTVTTTPIVVTRIRATNSADYSCASAPDIKFNYVANASPLRLRTSFSWREVACTTNYEMFYPGRTYGGTATINGEVYAASDADGKSPALATGNTGFCSGEIKIMANIEGFFDYNSYMMVTNLLYCNVNHGNEELSDTVSIELRPAANTYDVAATFKTVLRTNGEAYFIFPLSTGLEGNSYWIVFKHRNSLDSWSANPVVISSRTFYDFTSSQSQTYGGNSTLLDNGNWGFYSGDISDASIGQAGSKDGIIESQDYGDMENAVYITLIGYVAEDITGDGLVESSDYSLMENNVYFTRVMVNP